MTTKGGRDRVKFFYQSCYQQKTDCYINKVLHITLMVPIKQKPIHKKDKEENQSISLWKIITSQKTVKENYKTDKNSKLVLVRPYYTNNYCKSKWIKSFNIKARSGWNE